MGLNETYNVVVNFLYKEADAGDIDIHKMNNVQKALRNHLERVFRDTNDESNWFNDED